MQNVHPNQIDPMLVVVVREGQVEKLQAGEMRERGEKKREEEGKDMGERSTLRRVQLKDVQHLSPQHFLFQSKTLVFFLPATEAKVFQIVVESMTTVHV